MIVVLRRLRRAVSSSLSLLRAAAPGELWRLVVLQLLSAVFVTTQLLLLREVLSTLLRKDSGTGLTGLAPLLAGLAMCAAGATLSTGVAAERQRLVVELMRREGARRILDVTTSVDLSAFDDPGFANELVRARQNAVVRPTAAVAGVLTAGQSLLRIIGFGAVLLVTVPWLLLVVLVGLAPGLLILRVNARDLHGVDLDLTEDERRRLYLEQVLSSRGGAKETRVFRLGDLLRPLQEDLAERRLVAYRALIRRRTFRAALSALWGALVLGGGLLLLVDLVLKDRLTPANAATAAVVVQQLAGLLRAVSGNLDAVYAQSLYLQESEAFFAREQPQPAVADHVALREAIVLDEVGLRYEGDERAALTDVSATLSQGQIIALVGENGSGKTTLAKVLCGLHPPTSGTVSWDHTDSRDVEPAAWRDRFAVVFQDFQRYELSARLNLAVGQHDATVEQLRDAARLVDADRYLADLPEGYETLLSPTFARGTELSLGQWQRIAIARAFLSAAPVLVLDEPTSALDPRVEQELLQRVRLLAGRRTVVVVSHRLSSVRFADQVWVLHGGRLVENGTHDELMAEHGHYAELFAMQAATYRAV